MQPSDALTIRAVLQEAKPLLLNRKVDKVFQLGRDEITIALRSKGGMTNLFVSAQAAYGRICLVKSTPHQGNERSGHNQSNFCTLLRKHLTGATLVGVDQLSGERIVDFVFSCVDEVGSASLKVLTAEIMGRHSNLIFWDKNSERIITASHVVTKDMSRQREVAANLSYRRPPGQDKPNVFQVKEDEFRKHWQTLVDAQSPAAETISALPEVPEASGTPVAVAEARSATQSPSFATVEQWLISTYTGLGRHLAEELVAAANIAHQPADAAADPETPGRLYERIRSIQTVSSFKPAMKLDLSRYTVLSWYPGIEDAESWKSFPAVNDLIEEYYRAIETRDHFQQLKERLRSEVKAEMDKIEARMSVASQHAGTAEDTSRFKSFGDLILAHMGEIQSGQETLVCDSLYDQTIEKVTINLNPTLSPSQNAQWFYRQYAKSRTRQGAATVALNEATNRLTAMRKQMSEIEEATESEQLRKIKDQLLGRKPQRELDRNGGAAQQSKKKPKQKMLSVTSSDGWTIYVGRNRQENDQLLNRLAQPNDIWLHILGQGGAHVLIRVPASKQEPPLNTIKEAAQIAARLSKAASGTKVRVVYTQCRYVKKISKEKPGLVRYENEKTIEVDTAQPMPRCMKQLFSHSS